MQKRAFGMICGQQRHRSAWASAQSDQGLHCPRTSSLNTTKWMTEEQRPGWYFLHAQNELNLCILRMLQKKPFCLTRPIWWQNGLVIKPVIYSPRDLIYSVKIVLAYFWKGGNSNGNNSLRRIRACSSSEGVQKTYWKSQKMSALSKMVDIPPNVSSLRW